ncbi:hypothetical protein MHYP_G00206340 [Metynnis hypsauchen]
MLGLLFLLIVLQRDILQNRALMRNDITALECGIPKHFGLFYAMGTALMMEGLLSACYHVCPNYTNFQFDTSFMYMIAGLCMLKLYQKRHPGHQRQRLYGVRLPGCRHFLLCAGSGVW